jgi:hypothetical protein
LNLLVNAICIAYAPEWFPVYGFGFVVVGVTGISWASVSRIRPACKSMVTVEVPPFSVPGVMRVSVGLELQGFDCAAGVRA